MNNQLEIPKDEMATPFVVEGSHARDCTPRKPEVPVVSMSETYGAGSKVDCRSGPGGKGPVAVNTLPIVEVLV